MSDAQTTAPVAKTKKVTGPTVQITLSGVKDLLSSGKTRKEIAEHYGVSQAIMKRKVWNHPSLRGKKVMGSSNMEFIDDLGETPATTTAPVAEIAEVATQVATPVVAEQATPAVEATTVGETPAAPAVASNDEWR